MLISSAVAIMAAPPHITLIVSDDLGWDGTTERPLQEIGEPFLFS